MYNNSLNELQKSKIYFQLNVQDLVFQIYIETFRYMFERKTIISYLNNFFDGFEVAVHLEQTTR